MPSTPCLTCGALTSASYCKRHRPSRVSPGRGSGGAAARFRAATLAKTQGRCALCGSTDRVEAHHIIGLLEGGTNDAHTNGQALCHTHHHQIETHRRAGKLYPAHNPVF